MTALADSVRLSALACLLCGTATAATEAVVVPSGDWWLVADLYMPDSRTGDVAAVLLLNKADGDRGDYAELAPLIEARGMAALALDLRGHGDSTNLGTFVPYEVPENPLIWDAEADVVAAIAWLGEQTGIDPQRIAVVGASYSGEEMAEAGRLAGYAAAYVALSPGSFSNESISGIDQSGVPWLFVAMRDERHLREITAAVGAESRNVELLVLPGTEHATRMLRERPDLNERIATWLDHQLARGSD